MFAPNSEIATLNKRFDGYYVAKLGARYRNKFGDTSAMLRFYVYNVFDKFYWGDPANAFSGFLILGSLRVFLLSARFDF